MIHEFRVWYIGKHTGSWFRFIIPSINIYNNTTPCDISLGYKRDFRLYFLKFLIGVSY